MVADSICKLPPQGENGGGSSTHFDGKEKLLSLGVYPDITLADARERRNKARSLRVSLFVTVCRSPLPRRRDKKKRRILVRATFRQWVVQTGLPGENRLPFIRLIEKCFMPIFAPFRDPTETQRFLPFLTRRFPARRSPAQQEIFPVVLKPQNTLKIFVRHGSKLNGHSGFDIFMK